MKLINIELTENEVMNLEYDLKYKVAEKTVDLQPVLNSQKSFYNKAKVLYYENGNIALLSYKTIVAIKLGNTDNVVLLNQEEYSNTTVRHINDFLYMIGLITKKQSKNNLIDGNLK